MSVLDSDLVRAALRQAWHMSRPGTEHAHEEGGFVVSAKDGSLAVEMWPRGVRNEIFVPAHPDGFRHNRRILATFHTHPNRPVKA